MSITLVRKNSLLLDELKSLFESYLSRDISSFIVSNLVAEDRFKSLKS
jgi:hypothetical protein